MASDTIRDIAGQSKKPNVVLIWADNMGWADLSVYGCPYYETPHLDALAKQGTWFDNAYACAAMCTPSRVGFLSGRYPSRLPIGIQEPLGTPKVVGDKIGMPPEHPTVASLLQADGYDTALIGKWHCGHLPAFGPLKSGFDEFFGFRGGSIDYFRFVNPNDAHDLWEDDEPVEMEGYSTELFSERSIEFVKRDRDNPFFLCLWYNAPHWPWEGPEDKDLSEEVKGSDSHRTWIETGTAENYAEVVKSLDAGVGSIMNALEEKGLEKDTLFIFSSDQGGDEMAYMGPYRRGRLHDGGIKVPLIVRWPGVVRENHLSHHKVIGLDLSATILSAAGVAPSPDFPLDGIDLLSHLAGDDSEMERNLFWRHAGNPRPGIPIQKALRCGNWKYLKVGKREFLFDLSTDINEANDLKEQHPDVFAKMQADYAEWELQMLRYDKEDKNFERVVFS